MQWSTVLVEVMVSHSSGLSSSHVSDFFSQHPLNVTWQSGNDDVLDDVVNGDAFCLVQNVGQHLGRSPAVSAVLPSQELGLLADGPAIFVSNV